MQIQSHKNLEEIFSKGVILKDRVINPNSQKKIQFNIETDEEFVNDLQDIVEHSQVSDKDIFAKRANLTQEEYRFVEKTGELHYQANIYNSTSSKNPNQIDPKDKCKCGCGRARGDPISLCVDEEQQSYFGEGIILFFFYTKKILILLFLVVVIYGIFALVTNLISGDSHENCDNPGTLAFLCKFKVASQIQNKENHKNYLVVQLWLGVVFCIVWAIGCRMIRVLGRQKGQQIDDLLDSSSDYVVFLEKLPIGSYSQPDVLIYMQRLWNQIQEAKGIKLKIKSVQIIYNMTEVREKIVQVQQHARKLLSYLEKDQLNNDSRQKMKPPFKIRDNKVGSYKIGKKKLINAYEQLIDIRQNFIEDEDFRSAYATECALVQFTVKRQHQIFINHYGGEKKSILSYYLSKIKEYIFGVNEEISFKGKNPKISRAPEPSDIFWLHCEKKVKRRYTFLVWIITFLLNMFSFGCLILFRNAKQSNPDLPALNIVSVIGINLFNRLIWNILLKIVFIEENYTKTINIMSVMNKSYISQSINIIIVPIILSYVVDNDLDGPTGLAGQVHDFQLTSFIFMTLFNLVNVPHRIVQFLKFFQCIRRPIIKYLCRITGDFDSYSQMKQALIFLYDPPLVPVAGFYVYITSIIGQAVFFCYLQPVLLFYLLGNIILFHIMNRYIVFRMSKITDLLDINIFETIVGFAMNIPLIYGVSSIVFLKIRGDASNFSYYVPSILCIIIWLVSIENPCNIYSRIAQNLLSIWSKCCKKQETMYINTTMTTQEAKKQKKQDDDKTFNFINEIIESAIKQNQKTIETKNQINLHQAIDKLATKEISSRKENYYSGIGTNDLFNFQSKLQEVRGKYHGKNKQFCQKFNLTMGQSGLVHSKYWRNRTQNSKLNMITQDDFKIDLGNA